MEDPEFVVTGPIRSAAFRRLLLMGSPTRADELAVDLGRSIEEVARGVDQIGARGQVRMDAEGRGLGWLGEDAVSGDPAALAEAVMLEGPVTFRPNVGVADTANWMDARSAASVLVTSSDGTFLGAVRREDLPATEPAAGPQGA